MELIDRAFPSNHGKSVFAAFHRDVICWETQFTDRRSLLDHFDGVETHAKLIAANTALTAEVLHRFQ